MGQGDKKAQVLQHPIDTCRYNIIQLEISPRYYCYKTLHQEYPKMFVQGLPLNLQSSEIYIIYTLKFISQLTLFDIQTDNLKDERKVRYKRHTLVTE